MAMRWVMRCSRKHWRFLWAGCAPNARPACSADRTPPARLHLCPSIPAGSSCPTNRSIRLSDLPKHSRGSGYEAPPARGKAAQIGEKTRDLGSSTPCKTPPDSPAVHRLPPLGQWHGPQRPSLMRALRWRGGGGLWTVGSGRSSSESIVGARASERSRGVWAGRRGRFVDSWLGGGCRCHPGPDRVAVRRLASAPLPGVGCAADRGASSFLARRCGASSGVTSSDSAGRPRRSPRHIRPCPPDDHVARVSHQIIHAMIYAQPRAGLREARCRPGDWAQVWGRQCHRSGLKEDSSPARRDRGPPQARSLEGRPPEADHQPRLARQPGHADDARRHPGEDGRHRRCGGGRHPPDGDAGP